MIKAIYLNWGQIGCNLAYSTFVKSNEAQLERATGSSKLEPNIKKIKGMSE